MLPEYTCNKNGEQAFWENKSKERITVLFCCNMGGSDKVLPFVIGKSKKSLVFNGVKQLPVRYDNSNNAWMTGVLFDKWLEDLKSRMAKSNKHIILFVDNFSGHTSESVKSLIDVIQLMIREPCLPDTSYQLMLVQHHHLLI